MRYEYERVARAAFASWIAALTHNLRVVLTVRQRIWRVSHRVVLRDAKRTRTPVLSCSRSAAALRKFSVAITENTAFCFRCGKTCGYIARTVAAPNPDAAMRRFVVGLGYVHDDVPSKGILTYFPHFPSRSIHRNMITFVTINILDTLASIFSWQYNRKIINTSFIKEVNKERCFGHTNPLDRSIVSNQSGWRKGNFNIRVITTCNRVS